MTDPISRRLDYLYSLEDGWLDGEGKALPTESREWAEKTIRELVIAVGTKDMGIFPTESGDITVEVYSCDTCGDLDLTEKAWTNVY